MTAIAWAAPAFTAIRSRLAAFMPAAAAGGGPPPARVEARSGDLLAVGTVHGTRMTIHLSRTADNAPVHDAALSR